MSNTKEINYFGKLRRRREFLKSDALSEDLYNFWESWFSKCSRKNSFLPFLESRDKPDYPTWLFVINDEGNLKVGLTIMSLDMSERRFPFVIYYDIHKLNLGCKDSLRQDVLYLARRYDKFRKITSIGSFDATDIETFESEINNNDLSSDLLEKLDDISQQAFVESDLSITSSYWINLNTSSFMQHDGTFTCALYNKVYG